jgi:hypothetical protein
VFREKITSLFLLLFAKKLLFFYYYRKAYENIGICFSFLEKYLLGHYGMKDEMSIGIGGVERRGFFI